MKETIYSMGFVKFNTDASLYTEGVFSLGMIIRNDKGLLMASGNHVMTGLGSSEIVEALALRFGVEMAANMHFTKIITEPDNLGVVDYLRR